MICPDCKGTGTVERHLVKTIVGIPYDIQENVLVSPEVRNADGFVVKQAEYETQTVTRVREEEQDAWADGATCSQCQGNGIVPG